MKRIILCFSLFLLSCSSYKTQVNYEKSHQHFLKDALLKLNISSKLMPDLPARTFLSIYSLDSKSDSEILIRNMIEDYMTADLLKNNVRVLERDRDAIRYSVRENGMYKSEKSEMTMMTHLKNSELILAYRILEFGIRTTAINRKTLYREALIRLHIRLINSKTGHIKLIRNIASVQHDEISNEMNQYYENFHYELFKNKFPIDKMMEDK